MKVSVKVKVFCYVAMNVGICLSSGLVALQGVSPWRSLIVFLSSAAWVNFMLWFLFKLRDKNSQNPRP